MVAFRPAVNHPKGTKNESNSQLTVVEPHRGVAVNHPKGTKNESNSQQQPRRTAWSTRCKSP